MGTSIDSLLTRNQGDLFARIDTDCDPSKRLLRIMDEVLSIFRAKLLPLMLYPHLPSARSVLPNKITSLAETYLAIPFRDLRDRCSAIFPAIHTSFHYGLSLKTNWTYVAISAGLEELIFRGCMQSLFLTEIPKVVLRKIELSYETSVDHNIAKIVRILFVSTLFTLLHIVRFGNKPGMLLPQFISGIYFSYLRERGVSIAELSVVHFMLNVGYVLLAGGLDTESGPRSY